MSHPSLESFQARAERLARATATARARPGFRERVMLGLLAEPVGWWSFVTPLARRVLPALVVLMLLSAGLALNAAYRTDEALAVAYGSGEVPW